MKEIYNFFYYVTIQTIQLIDIVNKFCCVEYLWRILQKKYVALLHPMEILN